MVLTAFQLGDSLFRVFDLFLHLPPELPVVPVPWLRQVIGPLVLRLAPFRVVVAPFDMAIQEAYVHAGWLCVALQVTCAVIQVRSIQRAALNHSEVAVRVVQVPLIPRTERGIHRQLPTGRLLLHCRPQPDLGFARIVLNVRPTR